VELSSVKQMTAVADVVARHSEEAVFLWLLRSRSTDMPHYSLLDLARLDNRVEGHIDGLRVAGEEGWRLARKEMKWKEPGEVFTAAVLAFESSEPAKIAEVLKIGAATPELARGVICALGWMEYEQAAPHIGKLCMSEPRAHRRIGIAAAAIHRRDPGRALNSATTSGDALLRARASRAIGELARTDLIPNIHQELNSQDAGCRFWAAWATALLVGYGKAIQILQSFVLAPGPFRERALQLALRRMNRQAALSWVSELGRKRRTLRMAIVGAGIVGDPSLVPWLFEQMGDPLMARVAGEAFTMITGADLAYLDLDGEKPEGFEAGPTEDPNDDNVEMDEDERLPWPDAALIEKWWAKRCGEFQPGVRHLVGKPISADWAAQVLRTGRQRQRAAAALELALLKPEVPMFEVRAPGFRQQRQLGLSKRM
jgi:uncharacterized protein (TIGR02270 family)